MRRRIAVFACKSRSVESQSVNGTEPSSFMYRMISMFNYSLKSYFMQVPFFDIGQFRPLTRWLRRGAYATILVKRHLRAPQLAFDRRDFNLELDSH